MPLIDYPPLDDLDGEARGALEGMRDERGRVPAFPRMLANNPGVLKAALGQFAGLMYAGDVDLDLKQLAFVVVSRENECAYCAASHGKELVTALGMPAGHLEAVGAGDYSGFTARQRAVAEFARQCAADAKRVDEDHIEALRRVGFEDTDIIELLAVVAQASFANTIVDAMGIVPGDQSPELERYDPGGTATRA